MPLHKSPPPPSHAPPSTFDILRWSDAPPDSTPRSAVRISATNDSSAFMSTASPDPPDSPATRPAIRTHQPAGGISNIMLGANLTSEEAEALQNRRPNSESKRREMSGSGIFAHNANPDLGYVCNPEKTMLRTQQPVSQISFGVDGAVSPRRAPSLPEAAKQRELSGTHESTDDSHVRKLGSTAKARELVGSNIFGPPLDLPPRSLSRSLDGGQGHRDTSGHTACTTPSEHAASKASKPAGGPSLVSFGHDDAELSAKKVNNQKVAELSGNNIFKDDAPAALSEKSQSAAKRREICGSDIFADEKPVIRDHFGGVRKPPGGESSLTLL